MNITKRLPGFEPSDWWDRIGPLLPDQNGYWSTRDVIGPRDACWVLRVREMLRDYVSFGPPVPADVFLLSVGEASSRDCTKIGGLPFWPHDRDWPLSENCQPLPFLAQFCFRESLDIVGNLPEDMLLLFGDKDFPSSIVAKWQSSICKTRLIEHHEMPCNPIDACFYGTRWRTENYPEAKYDDQIVLANGNTVSDLWFVSQVLGMQIGRHPLFPAWEGRPQKTKRVICSMSAVFPIPGYPYPFLNRSRPLTNQEVEGFAFDLSEIKDADGFGVVCISVGDSGEPIVWFENL